MSRAERYAAAGIVLLAAALRFIHLGEWSFWADEIYTLRDAAQFPKPLRLNPLPYAAVSLCLKLFGTSEWSARLAPALIGTASVPLTLALGRRLLGMRVGLIASALAAVSPWHLYWSQNARHYAFAFFFALLAAWAFYAAFEKGGIWRTLSALGALICLALSHTPASVLWLGFAGYAFIRWRLRARFPLPQDAPRFCLLYFGPIALAGLAALTVRNYRTDLKPLFDYMEGRGISDLRALDRYGLRAYLAWLVELGYERSSVVRKLSALRSFLR